MEKIKIESNEIEKKTVEQQANYEGNHSLLLFERLTNPIILERLVNDMYEDKSTVNYSDYEYINLLSFREDNDFLSQGEEKAREEIKKKILARIEKVKNRTQITFSEIGYIASEKGEYGLVGILCGSDPLIKKYESAHTKNITEAHEKGHIIRRYELDSQFSKKVKSVFNLKDIQLPKEVSQRIARNIQANDPSIVDVEIAVYFSTTEEIIERMSQLKNYFGMSGTEEFTKEHLKYAKKHYVEDTGIYPYQIQPFLDAIEDEDGFVELMNTLGI